MIFLLFRCAPTHPRSIGIAASSIGRPLAAEIEMSPVSPDPLIILYATAKIQKILPPNFIVAERNRHLAKDSACGENSLARSKNPNRSKIPKATRGLAAFADQVA